MSPSEFDLRAALHDGEGGDDLNVDQLIQHARARVTQRRVRLLSGAAIVAVVAGVATGGTLLAAGNGSQHSLANDQRADTSAGSAPGGQAAKARAPAPVGGHGAARSSRTAAPTAPAQGGIVPMERSAATCPRRPPPPLPGGRSPDQSGTGGPLFTKPVVSIVVCGYGNMLTRVSAPNGHPARLELHDGAATRLAASLESAPKVKLHVMCPDYRTAATQQVAIIGIAANGTGAGTVTTTIGMPPCAVEVTNGTAVRYDWSPPADIARRLAALNPAGAPVSPAPVTTTS